MSTPTPARPVSLVAPIRWARELGYLMIWDAEIRTWHEVPRAAVPRWWAAAAQEAKRQAQYDAETGR